MLGESNEGPRADPGDAPATRVCIVTGLRLYRDGIAQVLDGRDGMTVVCATTPGPKAIEQAVSLRADLVLVDVSSNDGLAMLRSLAERLPDAKLVALSVSENEWEVLECARAGVTGYVSRDATCDDLADAVEGTARGELRCPPRVAAILRRTIASLAANQASGMTEARLTTREYEIVRLIAAGLSNREIGQRLGIEESTVKNHVHNILEKLRVRRRGDVATRLRRVHGLGQIEFPLKGRDL